MNPFVLDTSVAISWGFADERSSETNVLLTQLLRSSSFVEVPALFFFELQNVLRRGEKQRRITPAEIQAFWQELLFVDFRVDELNVMPVHPSLIDLSRQHNLSAYDAAYLDLAQRRSIPLATKDKALRVAAATIGISLLP